MPEIDTLFAAHRLNDDGLAKVRRIAETFDGFLSELEYVWAEEGDARSISMCRTRLEEACFHAKKAIALNKQYQEKEER